MKLAYRMADPTGLCFGVKRAIAQLEQALANNEKVYCLGSPIHNPQEVARLAQKGLLVVSEVSEVPDGALAFVRAHGMAPRPLEELKARGVSVIDGTCPFVRVAQSRARELSEAGYHVLIAGDESHPEIVSIRGHVSGSVSVVSCSTELSDFAKIGRIGIVSQTTLPESTLAAIVAKAIGLASDVRVFNTICRATVERQRAVSELASKADGIVLIGGKNSANTRKLYQIATDQGCEVQWIEEASELERSWFQGRNTIGIAAGASTPDWLIEQFIHAIENQS